MQNDVRTGMAEEIHAKVKQFAEKFELNKAITRKLNGLLLQRRKSLEDDLEDLSHACKKAPSATAAVFAKIREMEEGGTLEHVPDAGVGRLVDKFGLDQKSSSDLTGALRERSDKKNVLAALEKHLTRMGDQRAAIDFPDLVRKILDGEELGPAPGSGRDRRADDPPRRNDDRRHERRDDHEHDRRRERKVVIEDRRESRRDEPRGREDARVDRRHEHRDARVDPGDDRKDGRKDRRVEPVREDRGDDRRDGRREQRVASVRDKDQRVQSSVSVRDEVNRFIGRHQLDDRAADALLACTEDVQVRVMSGGEARNMNSVIMARIKEAKLPPTNSGRSGGRGDSGRYDDQGHGRRAREEDMHRDGHRRDDRQHKEAQGGRRRSRSHEQRQPRGDARHGLDPARRRGADDVRSSRR